jgi:hypothetical protein
VPGVLKQQARQFLPEPGVQALLRLVDQQQPAGPRQRGGQRQPLPLTGGQVERDGVGPCRQPERLDELVRRQTPATIRLARKVRQGT